MSDSPTAENGARRWCCFTVRGQAHRDCPETGHNAHGVAMCACKPCGRPHAFEPGETCIPARVIPPVVTAEGASMSTNEDRAEAWLDCHGDVWTEGDDGMMHTPETAPFPREHIEKKWGPLRPARTLDRAEHPATPAGVEQNAESDAPRYASGPYRHPIFKTCVRCFALVDGNHTGNHDAWHTDPASVIPGAVPAESVVGDVGEDRAEVGLSEDTCTPMYGSCALLRGHVGPHHGYPENIAAILAARHAALLAEVEGLEDESAQRFASANMLHAKWRDAEDRAEAAEAREADLRAKVERVEALADRWIGLGIVRSMTGTVSADRGHDLRAALGGEHDQPGG